MERGEGEDIGPRAAATGQEADGALGSCGAGEAEIGIDYRTQFVPGTDVLRNLVWEGEALAAAEGVVAAGVDRGCPGDDVEVTAGTIGHARFDADAEVGVECGSRVPGTL